MQPLASVAELRRLTGATWDDLAAQSALAAASAQVRAYCGWAITVEDHAEVVLDSPGGRLLTLPCLRVTAVHTVTLTAGGPVTDYSWSEVGVLHRVARWPAGLRAVTVVYSGGHTTSPLDVAAVVCGLAGRLTAPAGVASMTVGSQSVTFDTAAGPGLSAVERAVLDRYRIVAGS